MDQSRFERPQKLALDSASVLERVLQIQQGPNGLEAAMGFLEEQAHLQEQDRLAEIAWLNALRESDDSEAQKIAAEVDSLIAAEAAAQASTVSQTELGSAEELATEQESHLSSASAEPVAAPTAGLRSDFEPVTASSAIMASGPIPKVVRRPSAFGNSSWLLLLLAVGFLSSIVGSSLIGEVGSSPGALPGLIIDYALAGVFAAGLTCLGLWLGHRHRISFRGLISAQYGVVAATIIRVLFAAVIVELVWVTTGQLGYTITGAAGELFQGSASIVNFAQTGRLAAIALSTFAVFAAFLPILGRRLRGAARILGALLMLVLLGAALSQTASLLPSVFAGGAVTSADPSSFANYAVLFAIIAFGFGVHLGTRLSERANLLRFGLILGLALCVLPVLLGSVLALVNPISTPKWLATLDLVFLPVGATAFIALSLASVHVAVSSGRGVWIYWCSAAVLAVLPLVADAQTTADQQLFGWSLLLAASFIGQIAVGTLARRYGVHEASLTSGRGIYGRANPIALLGLVAAIAAAVAAFSAGIQLVWAASIAFGAAALWSVSVGIISTRRQDAELRLHSKNRVSMFDNEVTL